MKLVIGPIINGTLTFVFKLKLTWEINYFVLEHKHACYNKILKTNY